MSKDKETVTMFGLAAQVKTLTDAFEQINARLNKLEAVAAPSVRALNAEALNWAIGADPYCRFEVLEDWTYGGYRFHAGQIIRADQLAYGTNFVKLGLKLGVPQDQAEMVAQLKQETEAMSAHANALAAVAKATAAEAEALAAKATMDPME